MLRAALDRVNRGAKAEIRVGTHLSAHTTCFAQCSPARLAPLDDSKYWNRFYAAAHHDIETPSTFAQLVAGRVSTGAVLFELGCGNGRDALFFATQEMQVIACDTAAVAIETLSARPDLERFTHRPRFFVGDMAELGDLHRGELDAVYSRFTLHAVSRADASAALAWASRSLRPGGRLFIEVRSVLSSLYGKGEPVTDDRDSFIHGGHRRRFVRKDELLAELGGLGFVARDVVESAGLAIYKDDDPVVIRVDAERQG